MNPIERNRPWCPICRARVCIRRVHPEVAREETERFYQERYQHPFDLVHVLSYSSDAQLFSQALFRVSHVREE